MYIPNDDVQNYPVCRLQLVFETFEHSTNKPIKLVKAFKVIKPTNKKASLKKFWDKCNNQPDVLFLPDTLIYISEKRA